MILGQGIRAAQLAELLRIRLVVAGLTGGELHAAQSLLVFLNDVLHAKKVLIDALQAALRLFLANLVLTDAGGLLKNLPPVGRVRLKQDVDAALLDDAVGVDADAGVHEQFLDILEPADLLVQEVLAIAGAIEPPGNDDLGLVRREQVVRIVEGQVDLGEPQTFAGAGTVEDHVEHLLAAEALGGLLAEDPLDGIDDVGLAAAVGADDGRNPRAEVQLGLIGEALETSGGETLEDHLPCKPPCCNDIAIPRGREGRRCGSF